MTNSTDYWAIESAVQRAWAVAAEARDAVQKAQDKLATEVVALREADDLLAVALQRRSRQ